MIITKYILVLTVAVHVHTTLTRGFEHSLGFRTAMKEYPALLDSFFVPQQCKVECRFPKDMDDNESKVAGFIQTFIQNAEVAH